MKRFQKYAVLLLPLFVLSLPFLLSACGLLNKGDNPTAPVVSQDTVITNGRGNEPNSISAYDWHRLTNDQRNAMILNFIRARVNSRTSYNCKTWVQWVVPTVSGGAVTIPQTAPNAYGWYWYPAPYVGGFCTDPHNVRPGQILQMWYNTDWNPRTAFVDALDGTGMWWIDCNWDWRGSIIRHHINFSDFYGTSRKVRQFSVHQIG